MGGFNWLWVAAGLWARFFDRMLLWCIVVCCFIGMLDVGGLLFDFGLVCDLRLLMIYSFGFGVFEFVGCCCLFDFAVI